MKKQKGSTIKNSILLHGLQQLFAFVAFACFFLLFVYSFISIKGKNTDKRFHWELLTEETSFKDTDTFDYMFMNTIQEIIRYNVAKSQLEVDGVYDGEKLIDIKAFVNRKINIQEAESSNTDSLHTETTNVAINEEMNSERLNLYFENNLSALYRLGDLLKWEKYGVNYVTTDIPLDIFPLYFESGWELLHFYDGNLNEEQVNILHHYLGDWTNILLDDSNSKDSTIDEAESFVISDLVEQRTYGTALYFDYDLRYYEALADILLKENQVQSVYVDEETGEVMVQVGILDERYVPEYWDSIFRCAEDWTEYWKLTSWVEQAVNDLAYNYYEYLDFNERYKTGETNIVYAFEMTMMGEKIRISNFSNTGSYYGNQSLMRDFDETTLDEYFKTQYGTYLIYRPDTMTFETNTDYIKEPFLIEIFSDYEYAYPETAKIWIAVDTSYPVKDEFAKANEVYSFIHPLVYPLLVIGIVCGAVPWFILFLYLSTITGYRRKKGDLEGEFTFSWFDAIPTEIFLVIGIGLIVGGVYFLYEMTAYFLYGRGMPYLCNHRVRMVFLMSGAGALMSMVLCIFWYSFIRRCRGNVLWKNSLIKICWDYILIKLIKGTQKILIRIYDNSNLFFRCILAFGSMIAVNLLLGVLFYRYWSTGNWLGIRLIVIGIVLIDLLILSISFINQVKRKRIVEGITKISDGEVNYQVGTEGLHGDNLQLAMAVNNIGDGIKTAVEASMKDERLKADLITNVSHDIKTPLTSIINYVDLLKREKIETEKVQGYIQVLDAKSQRLKQLTDDLVEASKISSGNITLIMEKIDLTQLIHQSLGEFSEKFEEKNLSIIEGFSRDTIYIEADSRRIWRVIENLFSNIYKYAMHDTRVYLDMGLLEEGKEVFLSIKNISEQRLNINSEELTERFIRGDVSRSTEGSGLGLSIAKNLTELQNGIFEIYLDGDLFKVTLRFPVYEAEEEIEEL